VTRRADWLVGQLPTGMLDDDFFVRFVSLFQDLATSLLDGVDNVPNLVDPSIAPLPVVRWLGSWIGVGFIDPSLPDALQRHLVRTSSRVLTWRGTKRGLADFLEAVTSGPVEIDESGAILHEGEAGERDPWVRVRVESTGWLSEEDFTALVGDEIPADVSYELSVGDRRIWPMPDPRPEEVPS